MTNAIIAQYCDGLEQRLSSSDLAAAYKLLKLRNVRHYFAKTFTAVALLSSNRAPVFWVKLKRQFVVFHFQNVNISDGFLRINGIRCAAFVASTHEK